MKQPLQIETKYTDLSMYFIRLLLLLFCMTSLNAFSEESRSSSILSEIKKISDGFTQIEQEKEELLPPNQAFKLTIKVHNGNTLIAEFKPATNYYIYKDKISFKSKNTNTLIEKVSLPKGKMKNDPTFGQTEVYYQPFQAEISLKRELLTANLFTIAATYQGCNEPIGVCYAPIDKIIELTLPATKSVVTALANSISDNAIASTNSIKTESIRSKPELITLPSNQRPIESESIKIGKMFEDGNFWLILASFFGIGLLLSFTPCVFPMVPILSGIIVNSGKNLTKSNGFILALAYVLGMSLTYSAAGVAAGLSGAMLSAALQNAWVLGGFALIFVILSLSMFGFYELQLPNSIQNTLSNETGKIRGGHLTSVFGMGALSALILGPCVAAPLAGALLYISQTRDVLLGGFALFAMALGMGVPLLALGASAGALLPKAGPWMESVKHFFGVLLLGVAIWLISPVIPAAIHMLMWATLLIISAIYLNAIDSLPPGSSGFHKLLKGIGIISLLLGISLLTGVLSGSRDILQPLANINLTSINGNNTNKISALESQHLVFQRVNSLTEFNKFIAESQNKYVMLDFYADWCISCKEMERFTFTDPEVKNKLKDVVLLQVDVTEGTTHDEELLKHFKLFGPPGILFFNPYGHEIHDARTIGYRNKEEFLSILNAVLI